MFNKLDKRAIQDIRYLKMAFIWSQNSYALRRQVGCIIVSKDGNIISDGYNGTPKGFENVCERLLDNREQVQLDAMSDEEAREKIRQIMNSDKRYSVITKPYVLHAESNAIAKLARSTQNSLGSTLYCTDAPCVECSKLIIQSGIVRVVYCRSYRVEDGIVLLKRAGIDVVQIPINIIEEV